MAAPIIQLTVDGETPIQLNALSGTTGILATSYNMAAPEVAEQAMVSGRDRNDLGVPSWQNVTETIDLLIMGATPAAVQGMVWSINAAIDRARQSRRTWGGTRVWLEVQHDADGGLWRSEVLAGSFPLANALHQINRQKVTGTLMITRRHYWEGALTAVPLSTALTGETTAAVTLYNADDAGASTVRNWINIGATRITGDLPAPLKLSIGNGEASAQSWAQMFTTNYTFMAPTTVDPIILGSQAIDGPSETWGGNGEAKLCRFALTTAQLAAFAGQYCRILVNFNNGATTPNLWVRPRVDFSNDGVQFSTLYYAPAQVRYQTGGLIDVGCLPLPPFGYQTNSDYIYLALTGQLVGGWSATVNHVQICATGHGLFRRLDIGGDGLTLQLETADAVLDDGPEGRAYISDFSTGNEWAIVRPYLAPLLAWPGQTNRLRVALRTGFTFPAGVTLKAQAWYRPRRLSL